MDDEETLEIQNAVFSSLVEEKEATKIDEHKYASLFFFLAMNIISFAASLTFKDSFDNRLSLHVKSVT